MGSPDTLRLIEVIITTDYGFFYLSNDQKHIVLITLGREGTKKTIRDQIPGGKGSREKRRDKLLELAQKMEVYYHERRSYQFEGELAQYLGSLAKKNRHPDRPGETRELVWQRPAELLQGMGGQIRTEGVFKDEGREGEPFAVVVLRSDEVWGWRFWFLPSRGLAIKITDDLPRHSLILDSTKWRDGINSLPPRSNRALECFRGELAFALFGD